MQKKLTLLPIFLIILVDVFGFTLVIPLLAIYAERFGASPLQATLLVSVFAVCQLLSSPILGKISDTVGRKPMLIVSQVGTLLGFIVLAYANALWMIYLSRMIDGATAGNISLAQAYISDQTEPHERSSAFALIGIAFGVGFFLGPVLTGYLVHYGLAVPVYAACVLSATSIVCTWLLLPKATPVQRVAGSDGPGGRRLGVFDWASYVVYFKRPILGGLLVQFFFYVLAFSTFTAGFALFAERRFYLHDKPFGPREIGYLFAYSGFLGIILQGGLIRKLVKRFKEVPLVHVAFMALFVAYICLGMIHDVSSLILVATLAAFGNGVLRPILSGLISQKASRDEQGVVLGLNASLNSLAAMVAPVVSGLLIEHHLLSWWAYFAAASALMGLYCARWGSTLVSK